MTLSRRSYRLDSIRLEGMMTVSCRLYRLSDNVAWKAESSLSRRSYRLDSIRLEGMMTLSCRLYRLSDYVAWKA